MYLSANARASEVGEGDKEGESAELLERAREKLTARESQQD